jgi:hypothetical protein
MYLVRILVPPGYVLGDSIRMRVQITDPAADRFSSISLGLYRFLIRDLLNEA